MHIDIDNFLVLKVQNKIIGCIAVEIYKKVGLLRSLTVDKKEQKKGYGVALTEFLFSYVKKKKVEQLYLLTTTASEFFKKFGFQVIDRTEADQAIQDTTEFKDLCPCSAILMKKHLT